MLCQREERAAGRPYPRTCPTCKLGPCQKDQPRTLIGENAIIATKDAEITRLTAELADLRAGQDALVAAAYEAAARWLIRAGMAGDALEDPLATCIRAMTTADATAAMEAKLRAERNKVRREVAKLYENGGGPGLGGWDYFGDFYDAILAMIEPEVK